MSNQQKTTDMSRRHFMALAGGAAGLATLAALGIPAGWATNKSKIEVGDMNLRDRAVDVLVVGGGMAGLFAAVKAHDAGANVMIVSKGRLGASGQTPSQKESSPTMPVRRN